MRNATVVDPPTGAEWTRSSRRCRRGGGCRCARSSRPGCGSARLHALEWGDVDERAHGSGSRRARPRRRAVGRRAGMADGRDRRHVPARGPNTERRVFPGFTPDAAKNAMARACKTAGIVHRHPHDLRHRYASREDRRRGAGDAGRGAARALAKSLTLDTYSHVLIENEGLFCRPGGGPGGGLEPPGHPASPHLA